MWVDAEINFLFLVDVLGELVSVNEYLLLGLECVNVELSRVG